MGLFMAELKAETAGLTGIPRGAGGGEGVGGHKGPAALWLVCQKLRSPASETGQSWQTVPSRVGLLTEPHPTSHLDWASGRDGPTARVAVGFGVKPQSCWAVTPRIQSPEPNPQAGLPNRSAHWLPAGPISSESDTRPGKHCSWAVPSSRNETSSQEACPFR